jgi:hypothetical protein
MAITNPDKHHTYEYTTIYIILYITMSYLPGLHQGFAKAEVRSAAGSEIA